MRCAECGADPSRAVAINPDHRHDEEHEKAEDEARMALRREHRFESFAPTREGNLAKWCVPVSVRRNCCIERKPDELTTSCPATGTLCVSIVLPTLTPVSPG